MKTEKEIKKHIQYLKHATDNRDEKQSRELTVRLSELIWVLDQYPKE